MTSTAGAGSSSDALPLNYVDAAWRIEIPVASRVACEGHAVPRAPLFTVKLLTAAAPEAGEALGAVTESWVAMDHASLLRVTASLQEAVDSLRGAPYRRMNRLVK
jgi:hypothetical protein